MPELKHPMSTPASALDGQIDGHHYKYMKIQPIEFCHANNLGACETLAIKYISRWKKKNGINDIRKAIHSLELLIELELKSAQPQLKSAQPRETNNHAP